MQLSINVSISVYTSLSSICDVSLSTAVEVLLPLVQLIFSFMLAVLALGDSDLMTRDRDRDAGSHSQYEFDIVPPACPRKLGPGPGPPTGGLRQAGPSLQVEGRAHWQVSYCRVLGQADLPPRKLNRASFRIPPRPGAATPEAPEVDRESGGSWPSGN